MKKIIENNFKAAGIIMFLGILAIYPNGIIEAFIEFSTPVVKTWTICIYSAIWFILYFVLAKTFGNIEKMKLHQRILSGILPILLMLISDMLIINGFYTYPISPFMPLYYLLRNTYGLFGLIHTIVISIIPCIAILLALLVDKGTV